MRPIALAMVAVGGLVGCGGGSMADERPAAARDARVQTVEPEPEPQPSSLSDTTKRASPRSAGGRSSTTVPAAADGVMRGTFTRLDGERTDLARYRGDVVLVVNTATACGYTPQLEGLEALYRARRADGLVVLGFPANDFAGQEPRSDEQIAEFCEANYGVSFPMFAKSTVTGDAANALFKRLSAAAGEPAWNFNKYLVDRRGSVVARFGAGTEPDADELTDRVDALL